MASFTAFATRNFTTFFAGMLIVAPVAGFLPIRALRSTRTSLPSPGSANTPVFFTSFTAVCARHSSMLLDTLLLTSQFAPISLTSSLWVIDISLTVRICYECMISRRNAVRKRIRDFCEFLRGAAHRRQLFDDARKERL